MNELTTRRATTDLEVEEGGHLSHERSYNAREDSATDVIPADCSTMVQVTLAKRVVRPGSNKILCMAAQTSVPLHDDDIASVSDLGLKLSDGTSVVLSVSSFNDPSGSTATAPRQRTYQRQSDFTVDAVPIDRIYDPARYEPNRFRRKELPVSWCLALALTAGCALFAGASLLSPTHYKSTRIANAMQRNPVRQSANSSPTSLRKPSSTQQKTMKPVAVESNSHTAAPAPKPHVAPVAKTIHQKGSKAPIIKSASAQKPATPQHHQGFFIPPPPPVVPLLPYSYGAPMQMPPQTPSPPAQHSAHPTAARLQDPLDLPVERQVNTKASAAKTTVSSNNEPVPFSIKSNGKFGEPFQDTPAAPTRSKPAVVSEAPLPGADAPLERIKFPEH